jgi:hypothetical protein
VAGGTRHLNGQDGNRKKKRRKEKKEGVEEELQVTVPDVKM